MDGRMGLGDIGNPAAGPLALAETVAARLCHDLSGLSGTLLGMLEMAGEEEGDAGGEALSLSLDVARALGGRVRLLRTAWGGVGGERDAAFLEELLSHAAGFPRTRTDWTRAGSGRFGPALARVLLNAVLVATESLPWGGTVHVSRHAGGGLRVALDGVRAQWPDGWVELVTAGRTPGLPESRGLQPALTVLFARADGISLRWDHAAEPPVLMVG